MAAGLQDPTIQAVTDMWSARATILGESMVDERAMFGTVDDQREFAEWLDLRMTSYPCAEQYPAITKKAKDALLRWRLALPRRAWQKFWKGRTDERVLKEFNEV